MKSTDLIVLGLAGVAVYMIVKGGKTGTVGAGGLLTTKPVTGANPVRSVTETVSEIFSSAGQMFDNGWRYFTDGTAIDPAGNYYYQGQKVWDAAAQNGQRSNWV